MRKIVLLVASSLLAAAPTASYAGHHYYPKHFHQDYGGHSRHGHRDWSGHGGRALKYRHLLRDELPLPDPEIRIPVAAYLPEDYVPDIQQRLALYRRLSDRLSPEMVKELEEELLDRFGPLPPEGRNLLEVVRAKNQLRRLGVKRLDLQDSFAVLQFARPDLLNLERLLSLLKKRPETFRLTPDQALRVRLPEKGTPFVRLQNCLKEVETFVKAE